MIYLFAAILTLLLIWAIGYILSDIGHIEGPSWKEVEAEAIGSQLLNRQQKLKDDKERLNRELIKLYKENKVNPVGGCLPMLLQMPAFNIGST